MGGGLSVEDMVHTINPTDLGLQPRQTDAGYRTQTGPKRPAIVSRG